MTHSRPPGLETLDGLAVGRDPRQMSQDELRAVGHESMPLLSAIRAKCLDCCCDNQAEVRKCVSVSCALWPFRMNRNPWRAPMSEAQAEASRKAGERLRRARSSNINATPSDSRTILDEIEEAGVPATTIAAVPSSAAKAAR